MPPWKKKMLLTAILSLAGLLGSAAVYSFTQIPFLFSAAVTCGTIFYHFATRLLVARLLDTVSHNSMDYTRPWFAEKPFEPKLYKLLRVKQWKKHLPTMNPQDFDIRLHSPEEIIRATCQAEVDHEINMVLSLLPIFASVRFGSLGVFVATSCASFCFETIFVIMQRFNRPRLLRLMKKQSGVR